MAGGYLCKYCKRTLSNERNFMRHECKLLLRSREVQSPEGQQAYGLYRRWLQKQRRQPPEIETFLTSAYYGSFLKFAHWCRETGVPDPGLYVELMVQHKIGPSLWRRVEAYQHYLDYVDKRANPMDQATVTVETLMTLAEHLECPLGEVFSKFKVGEILELIQQRRLSPWLLFCSSRFKAWTEKLEAEDREMLMSAIGVSYWAQRLQECPAVVTQLQALARELEI